MAIHGLTRVRFDGDKAIIIAGAIPASVAVRGLAETLVEAVPVVTPMTPVRPIPQRVNKPPLKVDQPQAEKEKN